MSDKPDQKKTAPKDEGKSAGSGGGEASPNWDPAKSPPPVPAPQPAPAAPAKGGSSAVAWLALLLIVALGAGAAWSGREALRRENLLVQRLAVLESAEDNQQDILAKFDQSLQGRLQSALSNVESSARTQSEQLQTTLSQQSQQLERLASTQEVQREELARFGATDRDDWLLAESEYLLRLANQRLIMAGDVAAASALLSSADTILQELQDTSLHGARGAVASDLAALRAVPKVDIEGLYLRLSALIEQVDQLKVFRMPEENSGPELPTEESWQGRLQQGYEQALKKLSDYVVIHRREVPYEALMDPQWEGMVRQNMRMLLEQSQVALLSGNQVLFRESLERAGHWIGQFFEVDEAGARAIARDIAALSDKVIAIEIPNVSRSLYELDQAMEKRVQLEKSGN